MCNVACAEVGYILDLSYSLWPSHQYQVRCMMFESRYPIDLLSC
jgi:hypothetical protein